MKLFADDALLFSTAFDPNISASQLESDLEKKILTEHTSGK